MRTGTGESVRHTSLCARETQAVTTWCQCNHSIFFAIILKKWILVKMRTQDIQIGVKWKVNGLMKVGDLDQAKLFFHRTLIVKKLTISSQMVQFVFASCDSSAKPIRIFIFSSLTRRSCTSFSFGRTGSSIKPVSAAICSSSLNYDL